MPNVVAIDRHNILRRVVLMQDVIIYIWFSQLIVLWVKIGLANLRQLRLGYVTLG
jgi:hypothetical protein